MATSVAEPFGGSSMSTQMSEVARLAAGGAGTPRRSSSTIWSIASGDSTKPATTASRLMPEARAACQPATPADSPCRPRTSR